MPTDSTLDALAHRFFIEFSRTEYALKAVGHLKRSNGQAEASWEKFAAEISRSFEKRMRDDKDLRSTIEAFLEHPPQRQMVVDDKLEWDPTAPTATSETDKILKYVKRARNNLCHGGKFNGIWFSPDRVEFLIPICLIVLKVCRECSSNVDEAYHG